MNESHLEQQHGATPFVPSDAKAALDRLWAECVAAHHGQPSAEEIGNYLDVHRLFWDMTSLAEICPEILEHLHARYSLAPGQDRVTVLYVDGREPEVFDVDDVRPVVDVLLAREYHAALEREATFVARGPLAD